MNKGFTLIELSIIIVIIGVLIAGIVSGTSLIASSKAVKLTNQVTELAVVINTFKSKYGELPGDFRKASTYFGGANCTAGDTNTDSDLCDGNGNNIWGGAVGTADGTAEGTRVLQHLSDAELIGVGYVGGNANFVLGENAVETVYVGGGINFASTEAVTFANFGTNFASYDYVGNFMQFTSAFTNGQPGGAIINVETAYAIDVKVDDGSAESGKVISLNGYGQVADCIDATTKAFVFANAGVNCRMLFIVN